MTIIEGKGLDSVVVASKREPSKDDVEVFALHQERKRLAKSVIVTSFGDKPLRAVQSAGSPKEMWTKLKVRYAADTMGNKVGILLSLLNCHFKKDKDMGDYLTEFETKFNKLSRMQLPVAEKMQVAFLLVSLSNEKCLSRTIATLKAMETERLS